MYIDETGNSDLKSSDNPNHRFLTLTGVIVNLQYISDTLAPELEALKSKYFGSHPDEPIILHRKEMVNAKPPFSILRDNSVKEKFNNELLHLLDSWQYKVISVIMDKRELKTRYTTWQFDPYHYCLSVLIERYTMFLEDCKAIGDVLAESRGKNEDIRLKQSFESLVEKGTDYIAGDRISAALTSKQLKVKLKSNNIAGLQLCDLLAHPSRLEMIKTYNLDNIDYSDRFAAKIIEILHKKYYQKGNKIIGIGKKLLP